jgi:hypothetical protein
MRRITGEAKASLLPLLHKGLIIGLLGCQGDITGPGPVDEKRRKALIKTAECLSHALVGFMQKP